MSRIYCEDFAILCFPDEKSDDLVELHLEADLGSFTQANKVWTLFPMNPYIYEAALTFRS